MVWMMQLTLLLLFLVPQLNDDDLATPPHLLTDRRLVLVTTS